MYVLPHDHGYFADLDNEERSALLWALELAHAVRTHDPGAHILLGERHVSAELLDDLADSLFLAGCKVPAAVA